MPLRALTGCIFCAQGEQKKVSGNMSSLSVSIKEAQHLQYLMFIKKNINYYWNLVTTNLFFVEIFYNFRIT
jgi:hypothetical protein